MYTCSDLIHLDKFTLNRYVQQFLCNKVVNIVKLLESKTIQQLCFSICSHVSVVTLTKHMIYIENITRISKINTRKLLELLEL